jgi:hypothetical protein
VSKRAKITPETPEEKILRLEAWTADLLSGMYVNCVYCGHRYGPEKETPVAMAEVLKAHIAECPEHPISGLIRATTGAWHLCQSLLAVRDGASDELIAECRDSLEAALVRAGKRP